MNRTTRNVLWGVGFVAGLTLLGAGAANADTTGEDGTASGTQILGTVDIPVNLGGNAISLLGDSSSSGSATNGAGGGSSNSASSSTSGADGTASGTQVSPDATAPVSVSGNAISVLGDSRSAGSTSNAGNSTTGSSTDDDTHGTDGVASGNQVDPDLALPINLGGNAISVLGDSSSTGSSSSADGASTVGGSGGETSGTDGIAGGNQVIPGVSLPVAVGGNAISVLGDSASTGSTSTGGTTAGGAGNGSTTGGTGGILGGTQVIPDVGVPVIVGGNAISVVGDTETGGSTVTTPTEPVDPTDPAIIADATSGVVALAAADGTLAITGAEPWGALLAAGLLLAGGLLFLVFGRTRRFAARD
jgi:hypothetical protein